MGSSGNADTLSEHELRLLDALANVVRKQGPAEFASALLLLPNEVYFPNPVPRTLGELRLLLARLLHYARLPPLEVFVEVFDESDLAERPGRRMAAYFAGLDAKSVRFGVHRHTLGDPELLLGVLAHEIAHAYRQHHRLEAKDRDVEEQLTDVTTHLLGFGAIATASCYDMRSSGVVRGTQSSFQIETRQAGYLTPEDMSFLLAVTLVARRLDGSVQAICDELPDLQAREVLRQVRRLKTKRSLIIERLLGTEAAVDGVDVPNPALPPAVAPHPTDTEPLWPKVTRTEPTYRMRVLSRPVCAFVGFLASGLLLIITRWPAWVGLAFTGILVVVGPILPWFTCTRCGSSLGPKTQQCPGCKRDVFRTVGNLRETLE